MMIRNFHKTSKCFNKEIKKYCTVVTDQARSTNQYVTDWMDAKPFHEIPGPKPLPIVGNLWRHIPRIGEYGNMNMYDLNKKYQEQYGDIVKVTKLFLNPDIVFCFNVKDIETIYRNEGLAPIRGDFLDSIKYFRKHIRPDVFQGIDGIFSSDGQDYIDLKSKIYPILRNPRYISIHMSQIDEVTHELVQRIRQLTKKHVLGDMPDNFEQEINKWNFETICYITLDTRLGILNKNPKPEELKFLEVNLEFFDLLYEINMVPNPWKYITTLKWRRHVNGMNYMLSFIKDKIDIAMKELENEKSNAQVESFLKALLKKDKKLAFVTSLDLLQGAIDTTSKSAHIILYYLAKNPDKQQILRRELKSLMPNLDSPLTPEIMQKMTYLKAVIKEGMRVCPIALGVPRLIEKDLVLSGYQVPKGTQVFLCHFASSTSDKYFPDSSKFIPERWLRNKKEGDGHNINPWAFQPFGFGTRSCIGRSLSLLELEILLARVIRNFKLTWHHEDMKFKSTLLYTIANPLKLRVTPVRK